MSLIGVGHAEAFQLLFNASGIFYALCLRRDVRDPARSGCAASRRGRRCGCGWRRVSGLLMTLLYIVLSVFPIIQVESVSTFALKITLMVVAMNLVGIGILLSARQRSAAAAAKAHAS